MRRATASCVIGLKADSAERLQQRVVQVGCEPVALTQRGLKFHRRIAARVHFHGELLGLAAHLPS